MRFEQDCYFFGQFIGKCIILEVFWFGLVDIQFGYFFGFGDVVIGYDFCEYYGYGLQCFDFFFGNFLMCFGLGCQNFDQVIIVQDGYVDEGVEWFFVCFRFVGEGWVLVGVGCGQWLCIMGYKIDKIFIWFQVDFVYRF